MSAARPPATDGKIEAACLNPDCFTTDYPHCRCGAAEWSAWGSLCEALKDAGAVTEADLTARATDDSTPGCRLFQKIRGWGDDLVAMRCKEGRDGCRK